MNINPSKFTQSEVSFFLGLKKKKKVIKKWVLRLEAAAPPAGGKVSNRKALGSMAAA